MTKVRNISKLIMVFSIWIICKYPVNAQNNSGFGTYAVSMQNDSISIKNGQFAFNSITINNNTPQNLELGIRYILPNGWNFVTIPNSSIKVNKGEFQTIPFRISPSKSALGDINYPVSIYIKNPISGKETSKTFYVKIKQNNAWNANFLSNNLVIQQKDSLSRFDLKIKNNGNKRELFEIDIKSELRLSLPTTGTQVLLWPGKDTTVQIYVATKLKAAGNNTVTVFIKSKTETLMLIGHVYFASETYTLNKSKYGTIPIDFQYVGINDFNKESGYRYFEAQGNYKISNGSFLEFRLRTNSYNPNFKINTHFYNVHYFGKKIEFSLGSLNDFMNYQINGYGTQIKLKPNLKNTYEFFGLKGLNSDEEILGFRQESQGKTNKSFYTDALIVKNKDLNLTSFFSMHKFAIKYSSSKSLTINAGYSSEKKFDANENSLGYMGGYNLETKAKWIKISSTYQHYSGNFPGITKGVIYGSHELRLGNQKSSFSLFSESNSRQPYLNDEIDLQTDLRINFSSNDHGFRYNLGNAIKLGNIGVSYISQYQANPNHPKMQGYKGSFNYQSTTIKLNQSFNFNYILSNVKTIDNNKFQKSINTYYQLKYKNLGLNAAYSIGPIYYFDYLNFISSGLRPKTHNVALFYEYKNKKNTFYDRINLSSSNNSIFSKNTIIVRNEINFDLPKINSSVSFFGNINVLDPKSAPSWNITLKKTLNLPVIFKQKYYSASIFLFKDKNNNDLFDRGEEPISNAAIVVNDKILTTNNKGMVFLKNVEKDDYIIDYRKIQNLKGWVSKKGNRDTLSLSKNTAIGVPFKQSKMVSGKVSFEIENSTKESNESLNGILVLAINKKGEIFKTSTNDKGEFYFNLSDDIYNIQIPTNIFGDNFFVEKSIYSVNLLKEDLSEIEFRIIQKKRKINIKKN